jgi:small ubiquitin-related modifier
METVAPGATDAKDENRDEDERLTINIRSTASEEISFKIKRTTPLSKVYAAYGKALGVNATTMRFMFDGQRARPQDTAETLGLEEGDTLDVRPEQIGGIWPVIGMC